jgi:hypothetical protein
LLDYQSSILSESIAKDIRDYLQSPDSPTEVAMLKQIGIVGLLPAEIAAGIK